MASLNDPPPLDLAATLAALPPLTASNPRAEIRKVLASGGSKIPILVVLDDDPTGTQTCHGIPVLAVWNEAALAAEFRRTGPGSGFFILTNSRALHPAPARDLITEICTNLLAAAASAGGVSFEVVLRGDSTLRGHFPLECDAASAVLGRPDATVLCPFFLQGGRYTLAGVHYVASEDGATLVPAAQTPFARDATFGYANSDLREYVAEKSAGAVPRGRVATLELASEIRVPDGVDRVLQRLLSLPRGGGDVIIVNAAAEEDVDVAVLALLRAAAEHGRRYLFRTGAAFVSSRLGISPIPPVTAAQLGFARGGAGGLVIAGSYVPKTTAQLEALTRRSGDALTTIVLDVEKLLEDKGFTSKSVSGEVRRAIEQAEREITRGQDVLVMTSRKLIVGSDAARSLDIGSMVAAAPVSFLVNLDTRPRYIIAKGGITSSDMATKGLRFKRAEIVGQAAAGVPLWRCDEPESKWAGIPYVVFPGNVGGTDTLFDVVSGWRVS
ncbi:hypothetical protein GGTG_09174 [Gaeumannomyces tritici R3-111a-1]|uniref:Ketose-bisphosphate aldolase class-II family protein n=1 Tax=Gaeumannomyces tritici (strain R3-111a-1) TaxID=644352 RepID=J3P6N2_GAET3|nr:hypothetical protein GGTG_09174 [Gaeumannomyces tritici R3-111a-1]EJT72308.1 hypothetical protein GGTG_09174 [Gaeumannomyces tritici R3-111a-1]